MKQGFITNPKSAERAILLPAEAMLQMEKNCHRSEYDSVDDDEELHWKCSLIRDKMVMYHRFMKQAGFPAVFSYFLGAMSCSQRLAAEATASACSADLFAYSTS